MRILFVLKGLPLLRHFEETLAHLAERGHRIVLADLKEHPDAREVPERLKHPGVSVVRAPRNRADHLKFTALVVRRIRDYLRYHEPALHGAHENRRRALAGLIETLSSGTAHLAPGAPDYLLPLGEAEAGLVRRVFQDLEDLIPSSPVIEQFIREQRPDLMLVTPLVSLGGRQPDFVKSARAAGVPVGLPVFSWDNLSNKGVMHVLPDRVFVWNEIQRGEATGLHGVDPSAVVVTGAPRFDAFYRMSPSVTREALCGQFRLDPRRALVAYLASSAAVSANEALFVERWLQAVREAPDPRVREAQVLIRPHPRHKDVWKDHSHFGAAWTSHSLADQPGVALMIAKSVNADQSLFDLLHYSAAVVGLNTSAELEAGILGKPVYTVEAADVAPGQRGSLHYHYLLAAHGGFVEAAADLREHVAQLGRGLAGEFDPERQRAFVTAFVRPRGADLPASPVLAHEIEAFGAAAARGRSLVGRIRSAMLSRSGPAGS
jgi:hypothetical protein